MSDYQALFDHDLHYVMGWSTSAIDKQELEKFNNSSIQDIKICEAKGFPQPCILDFNDPELGQTQFILSTIRDFNDDIVLYNVIKEKMSE